MTVNSMRFWALWLFLVGLNIQNIWASIAFMLLAGFYALIAEWKENSNEGEQDDD